MSTQDRIWKFEDDVVKDQHAGSPHESVLTILNPSSGILVSAPHCVKHMREGKIKAADINTYGIAMVLQEDVKCNLIASIGSPKSDPNYDERCYYKDILDGILEKNKMLFLIDIHGMANKDPYVDIDYGDNMGSTLCDNCKVDRTLRGESNGLIISRNSYFSAKNSNTIANYVSRKFRVPSIQAEISMECRCTNTSDILIPYLTGLLKRMQFALE